MSGLPEGWISVRLEELASKVGSGSTPKGGGAAYKKAGTPLIRSMNVVFFGFKRDGIAFLDQHQADELRTAEVAGGDVLLNITGASIGRVTIAPSDMGGARVNQHVCIVRPNEALDARFLSSYLSSPDMQRFINNENYGVTRQALTKQQILDIEIPFAPLSEQKRIAEKLDALLAHVDAARRRLDCVPVLLKRFRQSVLAAATSGELTEEWCVDTQREWEEVTIGDVCESSFYGPRFGKDEYTNDENGIPTVRTTDMTDDGRIEITENTPRVVVPEDKIDKFAAKPGDLLVTRTGSIGVMAVFDERFVAIPGAYLIRFRFKESALPRYAFYCLTAPAGQSAMGLSTTAITQPNINAESIKAISISLPAIDEQREIIRRVEALFALADKVQAQYEAARARVGRLTSALLAKAFRGELVPQDPNDEPASVLLERLQAGKASAPKPVKKGRKSSATVRSARSASG